MYWGENNKDGRVDEEGLKAQLEYAKSLGYIGAKIKDGKVVVDRMQMQEVQEAGLKNKKRPKNIKDVSLGVQKPKHPGKGASDQEWQRYATEVYAIPGATINLPKIRSGKRRGWDILRMIKGETVGYSWMCGCKQDAKGNITDCGTDYCYRKTGK